MEAVVYNQKGEKTGSVKLPENVFGVPFNADLVHQVAVSMQGNLRHPVAHAKGRGEVRGGGKKPWQQKGTGRARHGSIRSPLWVGGGVAHGPTNEKIYARKINRSMKAKALFVALSKKLKDGEVLFLESLSFKEPKTKIAKTALDALASIKGFERLAGKKANAAHFTLPEKDRNAELSFRNFRALSVGELRNLNILDVLSKKYLVVVNPEESVEILAAKTQS